MCCEHLQLVGKRYPLKAARTVTEKKNREKEQEKKKTVPFRENLLGSILRSFPGPIPFFMLGAVDQFYRKPPKTGAYQHINRG